MPATYEPIATTTLGSSATSTTFSSISSAYTDLILVVSAFGNTGGVTDFSLGFQLNGDTATNYSRTTLLGDGSSAVSGRASNITYGALQLQGYYTTTEPVTAVGQFMNYSNTTTFKTVIARSSLASAAVETDVSLWRNTAAINSIKVIIIGGSMKAGSTFTLYGIKSAQPCYYQICQEDNLVSMHIAQQMIVRNLIAPKVCAKCTIAEIGFTKTQQLL